MAFLHYGYIYYSTGSDCTTYGGVRPVVYLSKNIHLSYDATNGYTLSY